VLVDAGDARVQHGLPERQRGRRNGAVTGARQLPLPEPVQVLDQVRPTLAAADAAQESAARVRIQGLSFDSEKRGGFARRHGFFRLRHRELTIDRKR
jgi:hypothetical protein